MLRSRYSINISKILYTLVSLIIFILLSWQLYAISMDYKELQHRHSRILEEKNKILEITNELQNKTESMQLEIDELYQENTYLNQELADKNSESVATTPEHEKNPPPSEPIKQETKPTSKPISNEKTIYLTFDDGPSHNTAQILDILAEYDVKATFFVIGKEGDFEKDIYRRIVNEGHALGNHTYTHNYKYIYSSAENLIKDVNRLQDLLYETTGIKPNIFRFPGGSNTSFGKSRQYMRSLAERLHEEGFQFFDWNVSSRDAEASVQNINTIISSTLEGARGKNNAIALFHDGPAKITTVQALPRIIEELQKQGFVFDVLSYDTHPIQFIR